MTVAVVEFGGSNCDRDAVRALRHLGIDAERRWHEDGLPADLDGVVLPGGFSYGDYLRSGAVARFSPIMQDVVRFAEDGGLVFGICNGFQVLCEAGLLPGTLMRNESLRFVCKDTPLRVENAGTPFTNALTEGQVVTIPVSHGEGRYYADEDVLARIEANDQVLLRYSTADGAVTDEANPNGSVRGIAGLVNEAGNVCGLMPHPERCVESLLGGDDGRLIFESLLNHVSTVAA